MKNAVLFTVILTLQMPGVLPAAESKFDAAAASFEELVLHAQRYGTTREKRENRKLARDELFGRGADSLHYLMQHIHLENDSISILVGSIVRGKKIDTTTSADVLIDYLSSDEADSRRMAAYFLGFCEAPEDGDSAIMPLLDDPQVAGAALRTLGKWKASAAAGRAAGFLDHDNERRRVLAANALREMNAMQYAPALVATLNDAFFTVRKSAARALTAFGSSVEPLVLRELSVSQGLARRELIRVLGEIGSGKGRARLKKLLADPDPVIREDARRALEVITRRP